MEGSFVKDLKSGGLKELILIDDEPLSNRIHSRLIESIDSEVSITCFTEPVAAMAHLKNQHPSALILLDINMPLMNAWDCLEYFNNNNIQNDVVILSSSINPQDNERASRYQSVKGFFNKPLTKDNIRLLLEKLGGGSFH